MLKNLLLKSTLLLCALFAGVSAWGAKETITYTFTSNSWEATDGETTADWTSGKAGNALTSGRGVQVTAGTSGANATSPTSIKDITNVVVTYSTNKSTGAGSISIQVGDNDAISKDVETTGGTSDRTLEYALKNAQTGKVKMTVNCTTNSIYVKSVAVTYATGEATTTTIDATGITNTDVYQGTAAGTLSASVKKQSDGSAIDGATVTWSSSDETVATIDASTGAVTLVKQGSVTFTATFAGTEVYAGSKATYDMTVTNSAPFTGSTVDFESELSTYTDWTFENVANKSTSITAHGGSKYGTNHNSAGTATVNATITTANTIATPGNLSFYVSKTSDNTTASTWTVQVSSDGTAWTDVKKQDATSMTKGTWVEVTAALTSYSNVYVRIYYYGSTAVRAIDDIKLTTNNGLKNPTVTVSGDLNLDLDGETSVSAGTLTAAVTDGEAAVDGATVTWSSSDETVATIDASTGAVTILATGDVTFTATFAGNDSYNGATGTKTVTVINSKAPGSKATPYTVAQAIDAIDNDGTTTGVYVKGIVSTAAGELSSGALTYFISDDGTTTTEFEIFNGKGFDGAAFTAVDDIQVGDEVVVYGNITYYADGDVYEFSYGSQLVSLKRSTAYITVAPTAVEATYQETEGTLTVTYGNITNVAADVLLCDKDGKSATYDWISAEIDNDNNVYYVIYANEGAARTAYLKVYALDDDENYVYSSLVTITQGAIDYATLPFSFDGDAADIDSKVGLTANSLGSYKASPYLKFDGDDDYLILKINEEPGTLTFDIKGNGFSGGTFTLQESEDGETYTDVKTYTSLSATQSESITTLSPDTRYIKWIYTEKSSGNVALGNITLAAAVTSLTATITAAGYATWVPTEIVEVPTGVSAFIVTSTSTSNVVMEELLAIPANTPVVLKGKAGSYTFDVCEESDLEANEADVTKNRLKVSDGTSAFGDGIYVLANKTNGVGFYPWTSNSSLSAGKVYLEITGGNARDFFGFGAETTGIERLQNDADAQVVFDLQGRSVKQPAKGLYIVNGKKVVIK